MMINFCIDGEYVRVCGIATLIALFLSLSLACILYDDGVLLCVSITLRSKKASELMAGRRETRAKKAQIEEGNSILRFLIFNIDGKKLLNMDGRCARWNVTSNHKFNVIIRKRGCRIAIWKPSCVNF
mgnify:CR=1 FL=1